MPTWQMLPDADNTFRWEISERPLAIGETDDDLANEPSHSNRLPSMADLLLQGSSRLLEDYNGNLDGIPGFRTGSGKPVAAKQSSISRALAILGNDIDEGVQTGQHSEGENTFGFSNSMSLAGSGKAVKKLNSMLHAGICRNAQTSNSFFQTGTGKMVRVSSHGLVEAKRLLGLEENSEAKHFEGFVQDEGHSRSDEPCMLQSSSHLNMNEATNILLNGDTSKSFFQTGSGKMVRISSEGLVEAKRLLGLEENSEAKHFEGFVQDGEHSRSDEPLILQSSSHLNMNDATNTLLSGDTPNSLFQTGSGKMVRISSEGLVEAKSMVGLEGNSGAKYFQGFMQGQEHPNSDEPCIFQSSSHLNMNKATADMQSSSVVTLPTSPVDIRFSLPRCEEQEDISKILHCAPKPPPIRFHTAGGRSISVSSDALQRARSLLGDHEMGAQSSKGNSFDNVFSLYGDKECMAVSSDKENDLLTPSPHQRIRNSQSSSKDVTSPLRIDSWHKQSSVKFGNVVPGSNLIKKFDAEANENGHKARGEFSFQGSPLNKRSNLGKLGLLQNGSKNNLPERSSGPLVDISNSIRENSADIKFSSGEKRRLGRSMSPFKKPRISKFVTPVKRNSSAILHGPSPLAMKQSSQKERFLMQFPVQVSRLYMKEYIGDAPSRQSKLENLPDEIRRINPNTAGKYMFHDGFGPDCIGAEALYHMLVDSGASMQYVSKEWVTNHYKWIVWKLASYERCYPAKFYGKLLTVPNVLKELKYRYEREVNHGHRSAIKRILEGDSPPTTRMVLCISSVSSNWDSDTNQQSTASRGSENGSAAKVELTDGWYSVYALLDVLLSKKLAAGKLFIGQKLRIWGAELCGWVGPVLPLEVSSSTNLLLHMNGTYRAHWADRLGFCNGSDFPLAFRCIKSNGGLVPSTLVGILRIYPVLYRERLPEGGFIVRSERMESKVSQLYNERRSIIAEGIMSDFQKGNKALYRRDDNDSEEGAKIMKILETAAEPEVVMAGMTSEQLTLFTSYRAKLEAMRESDMKKSLEKALNAEGLTGREVTPFMRVRVVGLTSKSSPKSKPQTGLITIWNPTEKQQLELLEGQAYVVPWLLPLTSDSSTLYLQTRGAKTKWLPLSPTTEHFVPFFSPRKSVLLSNLGEIPFSSEFDAAALVIYVGNTYITEHQKKQWVFLTDGSRCEPHSGESLDSLLAISFSASFRENDRFEPVNQTLAGSMVGFLNLVKRAKDQANNFWVAEATENSTYSLTFDDMRYSHLKDAADSVQKWANISSSVSELWSILPRKPFCPSLPSKSREDHHYLTAEMDREGP